MRELSLIDESMTVKDLVKYAIVEPYLYETHKA